MLRHGYRHNSECLVGMFASVRKDRLHNRFGSLGIVAFLPALLVHAVHVLERQTTRLPRGVGTGAANQAVVVELVVRERDQQGVFRVISVPSSSGSLNITHLLSILYGRK